jgi:hypothetical protein
VPDALPTIANIASRSLLFGYSVVLRALVAIGGALTAYGATGMFTTAGLMPPNALVTTGLFFTAVVVAAMWSRERRLDGVWPALLIAALPFSLYAFGSLSQSECAPPYQPQTPTYSCAPVGSRAIAAVAPVLTVLALALLIRDVRVLAQRLFRAA